MKLSQPQVISNCEKKEHCFEGEHWASRLKTPSSKNFICTSGIVSSLLYDPTNKFDMHIVIHSQITHSTVDSIQKILNRTWKKPFFLYSDQTNGSILHSAFRNTSYSCMHLKPPDIQLLEIEFHFTLIFILALFFVSSGKLNLFTNDASIYAYFYLSVNWMQWYFYAQF